MFSKDLMAVCEAIEKSIPVVSTGKQYTYKTLPVDKKRFDQVQVTKNVYSDIPNKENLIKLLAILPTTDYEYGSYRDLYVREYLSDDIRELGYYDSIYGRVVKTNYSLDFIKKWYVNKGFKFYDKLPIPYQCLAIKASRKNRIPNPTEIERSGRIERSAFKSNTHSYDYCYDNPDHISIFGSDDYSFKIQKKSESTLKRNDKVTPSLSPKKTKTKMNTGVILTRDPRGVYLRWDLEFDKTDKEIPKELKGKGYVSTYKVENGQTYKDPDGRIFPLFDTVERDNITFTLSITTTNKIVIESSNGFILFVGSIDLDKPKEIIYKANISQTLRDLVSKIIVNKVLADKNNQRLSDAVIERKQEIRKRKQDLENSTIIVENREKISERDKRELINARLTGSGNKLLLNLKKSKEFDLLWRLIRDRTVSQCSRIDQKMIDREREKMRMK